MSEVEDFHETEATLSRRRALKIGSGVAVGAVVWTEPTIRGLARRPAYAAAGSGPPIVFDLANLFPNGLGDAESGTVTVDGVTLTVTRGSGSGARRNYAFEISPAPASYALSGTVTFTLIPDGGTAVGPYSDATPDPLVPGFRWRQTGVTGGIREFELSGLITCE